MTIRMLVVVGSTRPVRVGGAVAEWFANAVRSRGGFEVEVADLAEIDLPLLDEPGHPRLAHYVHDHTRAWSRTVEAADVVAFVMPEYNHSFGAPVKNAIDYLAREWRDKSVAFVGYGGVAGGTRAIQALRPVLLSLKAIPVLESVIIPHVGSHLDEGVFRPTPQLESSVDALLAEVARREPALRMLRTPDPAA